MYDLDWNAIDLNSPHIDEHYAILKRNKLELEMIIYNLRIGNTTLGFDELERIVEMCIINIDECIDLIDVFEKIIATRNLLQL